MKKVLILLLIVMMLTGCHKSDPFDNDPKQTENGVSCSGSYYLDLLKNFEVRDKSRNSPTDNDDFEQFLTDIFSELVTSTYLDLHYLVTDYRALNLEKPEVSLGSISYSLNTEQLDYYASILEDLETFDYYDLSLKQQYDYEALKYWCIEQMGSICFYRYDFILSIKNNIPEDQITYFSDFTFYDEESIEDYLICLKDMGRYFDEVLKYTQDQADAGYPLLDEWIDYTQDVTNGFLKKSDDNELITSFNARIDALDFIDESKKEKYKKENRETIFNVVMPAYRKVGEEIEKYRGSSLAMVSDLPVLDNFKNLFRNSSSSLEEQYALYKLDKDYAEFSFMLATSCNKSMDDMLQIITDAYSLIQAEILSAYYDGKSWQEYLDITENKNEILNLKEKDCLEYLRTHTDGFLPYLGDVEYTVDVLDPDTAPEKAIAYYWPNPIDNYNQNIIRLNPNNMDDGYDGYGTLAHEGFPGHLFQNVFYSKTNPNPLRRTIGFLGYAEGWAVYATYLSYLMADLDYEYTPAVLFYDTNYYFFEYSIIDLLTNYYGYNTKKICDYLSDISIFNIDEKYVGYIRDYMLTASCIYPHYGFGSSEIFEMREKVSARLGSSFDLVDFNEALLINGDLPISVLEKSVYDHFDIN